MNQDKELWESEDWYPPLCPPKTPKEDLLRNEDFTEVDKDALAMATFPDYTARHKLEKILRQKLDPPKDSFDKLVQHLTSHLNSSLHKLRAIFVWMGAQNIGCGQERGSCEDSNSPEYYLQEALNDNSMLNKMFAKMCRAARIPCVLVNGKAKGTSYEQDGTVKEYTWAVVYVAESWRFVLPFTTVVRRRGHRKENLVLLEDREKAIGARLLANVSTTRPNFDEFCFLTDPEEMIYICHPNDKEKQLLTDPWTLKKFMDPPFFATPSCSSGWQPISPLTCVIKSTSGWCLIDIFGPGAGYKLTYRMFFDESRSGRKFPKGVQQDRYVAVAKWTPQTASFLVRFPVTGTYKFELLGVHEGQTTTLITFRIICDTEILPSYPENGFGFGEAAAEAGLSEPSHTEGIVQVKSGDKISLHFKVKEDVDILARLVHPTRTPEELRDNISVQREDDNITVKARLPADDPTPEYFLQVDTIKNIKERDESIKPLFSYHVLNYLLTSDERVKAVITDKDKQENVQHCKDAWVSVSEDDEVLFEHAGTIVKTTGTKDPILEKKIRANQTRYQLFREEMLTAERERNLDRLNKALTDCMAVNRQNKKDIEDAKTVLTALCQEEMEKVVQRKQLVELRECLKKIDNTCVGKVVKVLAWFKEANELLWKLEVGDEPPNHVIDVIVAAFILLGESEEELNTWQKVNAKLKETNEEQLINKVKSLKYDSLTKELMDLAKNKLDQACGAFGKFRSVESLKKQCLDTISIYQRKVRPTRKN